MIHIKMKKVFVNDFTLKSLEIQWNFRRQRQKETRQFVLFPINMERISQNDWNCNRMVDIETVLCNHTFLSICVCKSAHGMSHRLQPIIIHNKAWAITRFGCKLTKTGMHTYEIFFENLLYWNRMASFGPIVCSLNLIFSSLPSKPAKFCFCFCFHQLYKLHFVAHEMCRNRAGPSVCWKKDE